MVMLNNQMVDSLLGIWHRNWGPSHWWQEASGSISVDSWCFGYCDETARIGYLQISAIRACCILNPHLSLPGGRQNAIPFQEPSRPMCSTLLVHVDKTAEHVLKDLTPWAGHKDPIGVHSGVWDTRSVHTVWQTLFNTTPQIVSFLLSSSFTRNIAVHPSAEDKILTGVFATIALKAGLSEIAIDQGLTKILSGWWFGTWLD